MDSGLLLPEMAPEMLRGSAGGSYGGFGGPGFGGLERLDDIRKFYLKSKLPPFLPLYPWHLSTSWFGLY